MSEIALMIGKRLRECRDAMGISQEDLAFRAGMHPAHVGQLERGVKCPTMHSLHKLLNGLGVSLTDFFNFEMLPDKPEHAREIEKINAVLLTLSAKELDAVHVMLKSILRGFKDK